MNIETREEITDNNGNLLPSFQNCSICYDTFFEPDKIICCPEHKHVVCKGCYRYYISTQIPQIFRYANIFSPLNDPENNNYDDNLNINTIPFHLKCICRHENQECSHNYNINTDEQFINFISEGSYNLDNVNLDFVKDDIENNGNFIMEDQQTKDEIRDIIIIINDLKNVLNEEVINNQITQIFNQQDLRRTFLRLQDKKTLRCPYPNCNAISHDFVNGCAAIKCNGCNGDFCHACHATFNSRAETERHIIREHGDLFNPPSRTFLRNYLKQQNIIREMTNILEEIQDNINNVPDNDNIEPPIENLNLIDDDENINGNNLNNNNNQPPIFVMQGPVNRDETLGLYILLFGSSLIFPVLAESEINYMFPIIKILQQEVKEHGLEWVKNHLEDIIKKHNLKVTVEYLKVILEKCIKNGLFSSEIISSLANNFIKAKTENIKKVSIDTALNHVKKDHGLRMFNLNHSNNINNGHHLNNLLADNIDDVSIELTKQARQQVYDNTDDVANNLVNNNNNNYLDSIKNSELFQKIKEIKNKKGSDFLDKLFKNPKFLNSLTILSNTSVSFFITYCMSSNEEVCDSYNMFIEFLKSLSISLFYMIPGVNIGFWSSIIITFISSYGLNLLKNKKTNRISLRENLKKNMEMIEARNNLEQNIENINNIVEEEINNDEEFRNIIDEQNREYEEALREDQRRQREEREREEQERQWQEQVELDRIQREEDEERYRPTREEIARLYERRNPNDNNLNYIEV